MPKLDYFNRKIRGTSYSRRLSFHACPHKYELSGGYSLLSRTNSVTFAYGHAVAMGIQTTIAGASLNKAILACWLEYDHDLDDKGSANEQAAKKSVHQAVLATELFWHKYNSGSLSYLDGWEVAKFKQADGTIKYGIELTYVIDLFDGFTDEGHIDLVLYHPKKNRYMVVEIKTTGGTQVHPAQYKYSDQPLGYGVVLDYIASLQGGTSSFDVLYLVWKSRTKELIALPFTKTVQDRSRWLHELLLDVEQISKYEEEGHFPHRGESCFNYFRPCEFFETCKFPKEKLRELSDQAESKGESEFAQMMEPTFRFGIDKLLERQDQLTAELEADGGASAELDSVELLLQSIEVTNV